MGIFELSFPSHSSLVQESMIAVLRNIDRDRMQNVHRVSRKAIMEIINNGKPFEKCKIQGNTIRVSF